MKKQLLSFIIVAFAAMIMAQSNATNFTSNDCSGVPHELFKELDSGKVIVLVWVMPCGACTGPAITAYNIVKDFQKSNPKKVFYYMVDDYANTSCQSLGSWCNSNGILESEYSLRFSNSGIKMANYGFSGMPKIVVLAGTDHKILYNVNNTINSKDFQAAINSALVLTSTSDQNRDGDVLNISPNPANQSTLITCTLDQTTDTKIELLNLEGKLMQSLFSGKLNAGENKIDLNLSTYNSGIYYVRMFYGDKISLAKFTVVH